MNVITAQQRAQILLAMARRRGQLDGGSQPQGLTWTRPVADPRSILRTPFAVTGGVATRLYMPERFTDDLDLIIPADTGPACARALRAVHARLLGPHPVGGMRWWLPPDFPTDAPSTDPRWDFLESVAYESAAPANERQSLDVLALSTPWLAEALATAIAGPTGLPVLTLPYLALMKLTSARLNDIADLCRMLRSAKQPVVEALTHVVQRYTPETAPLLADILATVRLAA
jgi:hypothetical protein